MPILDQKRTMVVYENDVRERNLIHDAFTADGYTVFIPRVRPLLDRDYGDHYPDVIVVDARTHDAMVLVTQIRAGELSCSRYVPIIGIGNGGGGVDAVRALETGCDDYMPRPFDFHELRARVLALIRRADYGRKVERVQVGRLYIDAATRVVTIGRQTVDLSNKEFLILQMLVQHPDRVFTKEELLRTLWGHEIFGSTRTLDSHVARLRQKLNVAGDSFVLNVWGVGYRLIAPEFDQVTA